MTDPCPCQHMCQCQWIAHSQSKCQYPCPFKCLCRCRSTFQFQCLVFSQHPFPSTSQWVGLLAAVNSPTTLSLYYKSCPRQPLIRSCLHLHLVCNISRPPTDRIRYPSHRTLEPHSQQPTMKPRNPITSPSYCLGHPFMPHQARRLPPLQWPLHHSRGQQMGHQKTAAAPREALQE